MVNLKTQSEIIEQCSSLLVSCKTVFEKYHDQKIERNKGKVIAEGLKVCEDSLNIIREAIKQKDMEPNKRFVANLFGDSYFTNESPLFKASITGILESPEVQGGNKPCNVVFK